MNARAGVPWRALSAVATFATCGAACGDASDRSAPRSSGRAVATSTAAPTSTASALPSPSSSPSAASGTGGDAGGCAPSLGYAGPLDGRSADALARCVDPRSPGQGKANKCADPSRPLSLARLRESVLPIDGPTRSRVAAVARKGRGLGRNPRAFGLAGDSMTASGDFMSDLGRSRRKPVEVAPELEALFALPSGKSVLDFFRGQEVERSTHGFEDAFTASRAAKVGISAPWLTAYDDVDASPIGKMVQAVNPAYAVVLVGGNDAARRLESPEVMARDFERDLDAVVVALERRGVVPILSTLARHLDQPGVPNCDAAHNPSDHRVGVVTTAISDAVARYACREHLPLVDVRHAFDDLPHHGLGADGMHPNVHPRGGSVLTAEGLACGYNVRNAVTLAALAQVIGVLVEDGAIDPG